MYRFVDGPRPTPTIIEESGSFGPLDHCLPVGCALGFIGDPPDMHEVDLKDHVPVGTPVRVKALLSHDAPQGDLDGMNFYLSTLGTFRASYEYTREPQIIKIDTVLVRHEEDVRIHAIVQSGVLPEDMEIHWDLKVNVTKVEHRVVERLPVAIPLPLGATGLRFTTDGEAAEIELWESDGAYTGTLRTTRGSLEHIFTGEQGDEAVVFLRPGSAPVRIEKLGEETAPGPLRALPIEETPIGEPRAIPPGETSWGFHADDLPLGITFVLRPDPVFTGDLIVTVESEAGVVMGTGMTCTLCLDEMRFSSTIGHPNLIPGDYSVEVLLLGTAGDAEAQVVKSTHRV